MCQVLMKHPCNNCMLFSCLLMIKCIFPIWFPLCMLSMYLTYFLGFFTSFIYIFALLFACWPFSPKYGMWKGWSRVSHVCTYFISIPSLSCLWFINPDQVLILPFVKSWLLFMFNVFGCITYNNTILLIYWHICPSIRPLALSHLSLWHIFTCVLIAYGLDILNIQSLFSAPRGTAPL